jgi:histidyl-tRNA synthetase
MKFKSIKGTKDILPAESAKWQQAESSIRAIMHSFNFREIRTPIFEETSLFARGIGELTDIVGKEMYTFQDRSGDSLTLKPEMTASVVRAYIQHNLGEQQPLVKVYYISPMFRQERPQAGRLRQFHQFGAEAIGGANPEIDAEIIALACEVYRALGIKNVLLKINSVGCEKCRPGYKKALQDFLEQMLDRLSEPSRQRFLQNPLRILDSKDETDRGLTKNAPLMKDHLCAECKDHFAGLQESLKLFEVPFEIDGRIVRGLDYYTKTAFEIVSNDLGSQDALAGGGRYDLLAEELGGKRTPGVGFAAGIERLLMVIEKQAISLGIESHPQLFLIAADEAGKKWVLQQALVLRRQGISYDFDLLGRSVKSQMREADRQHADFCVVIGNNELQKGTVEIKNLKDGTLQPSRLKDFIEDVRSAVRSLETSDAKKK